MCTNIHFLLSILMVLVFTRKVFDGHTIQRNFRWHIFFKYYFLARVYFYILISILTHIPYQDFYIWACQLKTHFFVNKYSFGNFIPLFREVLGWLETKLTLNCINFSSTKIKTKQKLSIAKFSYFQKTGLFL